MATLLTGQERLASMPGTASATVLDFWRWSSSDLLSNATRGVFAEFLVGTALDCLPVVRDEWGTWDLKTKSGTTIEVKSSAYLQSWSQNRLSNISFGIAPRRAWDPAVTNYIGEPKRHADLYVFCLLAHKERATVDPLDLRQWGFFVLPSRRLDELGAQKQISLGVLESMHPTKADWTTLAAAVLSLQD